MLVACRLVGLSALGAHYAGVRWRAIRGRTQPLLQGIVGDGGIAFRLIQRNGHQREAKLGSRWPMLGGLKSLKDRFQGLLATTNGTRPRNGRPEPPVALSTGTP